MELTNQYSKPEKKEHFEEIVQTQRSQRLLVVLFLAFMGTAVGASGILSPNTFSNLAVAILVMITFVASGFDRALAQRLIGLGITAYITQQTSDTSVWLFLWSMYLGWLSYGCRRDTRATVCTLALASFYMAILYACFKHIPAIWKAIQTFSVGTSSTLSSLSSPGVYLGAEASGLWFALALVCLGLAYMRLAKESVGRLTAATCIFSAVVFFLGYQIFGVLYAPSLSADVLAWLGSSTQNINTAVLFFHAPLFLLVTLCVFAAWLLPGVELKVPERRWGLSDFKMPGRRGLVLSSLVVALISGLLISFYPASQGSGGKVVFYNVGMLNWTVPVMGKFGIQQAGMFGMLPKYLKAADYTVTRSRSRGDQLAAELEDASVMVVINPTEKFSAPDLESIWAFVERGGGLLVLGDHTDIMGTMEPLNALLEPVNISFAFDSAFSIRTWESDYDFAPHPITRRLDWSNGRLQQSTGASLILGAGGRSIVSDKYGFSDAGVRENEANGFLGDYRYQLGEQLGGLPIIAEARYGRGKVIAFGDTSAFQNVAISHSALFLLDVFAYLSDASVGGSLLLRDLLLAFMALILVVLITIEGRALLPICGVIGITAVAVSVVLNTMLSVPLKETRLALIDAAHINRFSLKHWEKDSLGGLSVNLARAGYLPLVIRENEWLQAFNAPLLFSVAPAKPFGRNDLDELGRYMDSGGYIILGVGWEERNGALPLLEKYGLEIEPIPLGPVPVLKKTEDPEVVRAMQRSVHFLEAWSITAEPPLDKIIHKNQGFTIVGLRKVGRGGLVLIADTKFLLDRTLEEENAWWSGNIIFLRNLLLGLKGSGKL